MVSDSQMPDVGKQDPSSQEDMERNKRDCNRHCLRARIVGLLRAGYFGFLHVLLMSFGRLSKGIRVGLQYGFDSGESLDYVYADTAHGRTPLSRAIDRFYLNAVGWQAMRERRANLQQALRETALLQNYYKEPTRIVDIASGPSRYVLSTISGLPELDITAQLRDMDEAGLQQGRELAERMHVTSVQYVRGNAFDEHSLSQLNPKPNIAIASGVYELFSDNDLIASSLRGLSKSICDGGYLVYTNQPAHPQLELIAKVLTKRNGDPWVMRCRSQAEIDRLVESCGFDKVSMVADSHGISTVSIARKRLAA